MYAGQLFSEHFLTDGIRASDAYQRLTSDPSFALSVRRRLEEIYQQFPVQALPDEAQTEQDLIFRVLEVVGWNRDLWLVQPRAARKGRSDVPDALLFPDRNAKEQANVEIERDRRFRHGVAILESKRWDRPLDRAAKGSSRGDEEREVPSTQILRYLSRAETLSDRRIQWAILTNGRLWRLYYQGAKSRLEEYLEIDLSRLLDVPALSNLLTERDEGERAHWLRVFTLMFGRASFDTVGDRTFHMLALDEGEVWEEQVAKNLSNLVFGGIFRDLVASLDAANSRRPSPRSQEYLRELKDAALTLLYRLLFVLYAEDRDLLPARDSRYGSYGLRPIRDDIAGRVRKKDTFFAATIGNYYARLRGLFRAIDQGEPSLGLPPYNGGLFDPEAAPLLQWVELPDAAFAPLLDALSRQAGRRINYRDLSVQQLGSIYERLLEHEVVEQDGRVEVIADEAARKGSGSFYTHEVLVQFILERAVGPLVFGFIEEFREKAEALAGARRPKAERLAELSVLDPASRLLEIKVCDPAMGSGHFLVSLVDFLADRVLEAVAAAPRLVPFVDDDNAYESPLVERLASIRERILQLAAQGQWQLDEAQLDDRHLVRRMILKRVVHGVDKNPMAVELAKVALWLHTFTTGAPLSFLDHHLRCGDSLLGMRVADANRWLQERGALTIHRHVVPAQQAASSMTRIETITDSDIAEVEESTRVFDGVRETTEPLGAFLSLIAAERLMGVFDAAPKEKPTERLRSRDHNARLAAYEMATALEDVLDGNLGDPIEIARGALSVLPDDPDEPASLFPSSQPEQGTLFAGSSLDPRHRRLAHELVEEARRLAHEHRFLHWELAFPNVWQDWLSVDPKGGFDAVIGNPPYVRQEQIRALKPALRKGYKAFDGMADLYVYFYELGLRLLRPGGRLSYVVTNKWLRAGYAEALRGLLSSEGWLEAVADFGHAKKFFPGADVFPCVIVARKPSGLDGPDGPEQTEVCQIPRDVVRLDRVSQQVSEMAFPLPRASFTKQAWQLDPPEVAALMDKIRRAGVPLEEYAGVSPQYGIKTGYNEAFLIDTPTRDALVAADPKCAEIIKPYLRGQDIERWASPWRGLWMILLKSSSDHLWPWADSQECAEAIFAEEYPSLHRRMTYYSDHLRKRQDQGRYWWELRSCAYYDVFETERLLIKRIEYYAEVSGEDKVRFINDSALSLPSMNYWVMNCLNSPVLWYLRFKTFPHKKDEAVAMDVPFIEALPIPIPSDSAKAKCEERCQRLHHVKSGLQGTSSMLRDWYLSELDLVRPGRLLLEPSALSSDEFVEQIRKGRGVRKPLSAAGVHAVREEYAKTVQPMQAALREAERLERRLSDVVNEAYGLTPDQVRLMWATAPPRMPLTPKTEVSSQLDSAAAE
jgi:hypothetical protein